MLKATGIVRRIDDLGRIVLPKEIRRTQNLREGDPMEVYTTEDSIVLKKYCPLGVSDIDKLIADTEILLEQLQGSTELYTQMKNAITVFEGAKKVLGDD